MVNDACQMVMPSSYVDMDSKDLQYDGGFSWSKALYIVAGVGAGIALSGFAVGAVAAAWGGTLASGTELAFARYLSGIAIEMIVGGAGLGVVAAGSAKIIDGPGSSRSSKTHHLVPHSTSGTRRIQVSGAVNGFRNSWAKAQHLSSPKKGTSRSGYPPRTLSIAITNRTYGETGMQEMDERRTAAVFLRS